MTRNKQVVRLTTVAVIHEDRRTEWIEMADVEYRTNNTVIQADRSRVRKPKKRRVWWEGWKNMMRKGGQSWRQGSRTASRCYSNTAREVWDRKGARKIGEKTVGSGGGRGLGGGYEASTGLIGS